MTNNKDKCLRLTSFTTTTHHIPIPYSKRATWSSYLSNKHCTCGFVGKCFSEYWSHSSRCWPKLYVKERTREASHRPGIHKAWHGKKSALRRPIAYSLRIWYIHAKPWLPQKVHYVGPRLAHPVRAFQTPRPTAQQARGLTMKPDYCLFFHPCITTCKLADYDTC